MFGPNSSGWVSRSLHPRPNPNSSPLIPYGRATGPITRRSLVDHGRSHIDGGGRGATALEKIAGLLLALQSADVFERKDAQERIHGDALEVMIRSSWHAPGRDSVDVPIEFCIRQQSSNGEMHIPQPIAARHDPLQLLVTRSHKVVYWLGSSLHAAYLFVWPAPERLTCSSG